MSGLFLRRIGAAAYSTCARKDEKEVELIRENSDDRASAPSSRVGRRAHFFGVRILDA